MKRKSEPPVVEITGADLEEIARLVADGYTSGRLDEEEGKHIYWEIKIECWHD